MIYQDLNIQDIPKVCKLQNATRLTWHTVVGKTGLSQFDGNSISQYFIFAVPVYKLSESIPKN